MSIIICTANAEKRASNFLQIFEPFLVSDLLFSDTSCQCLRVSSTDSAQCLWLRRGETVRNKDIWNIECYTYGMVWNSASLRKSIFIGYSVPVGKIIWNVCVKNLCNNCHQRRCVLIAGALLQVIASIIWCLLNEWRMGGLSFLVALVSPAYPITD